MNLSVWNNAFIFKKSYVDHFSLNNFDVTEDVSTSQKILVSPFFGCRKMSGLGQPAVDLGAQWQYHDVTPLQVCFDSRAVVKSTRNTNTEENELLQF